MKRLAHLAALLCIASIPLSVGADTLVTRYWPMNDGDIRYFSGAGGSSYLEFIEDGFGELPQFSMNIYRRESPGEYYDEYGTSTYGYSAALDSLFNYGQQGPIGAYLYFQPAWSQLTESLLVKGGTKSSRFYAGVPYVKEVAVLAIVKVARVGTVTVPAGTFNDCRSVSFTVRVAGQGGTVSGQAMILAPRVGPIRLGVLNAKNQPIGWQSLTGGTVDGVDVRALVDPPVIVVQPRGKNVREGQKTRLFVRAKGPTSSLTYQWYFNNAPIAGANQSAYTLSKVQQPNAGNYFVVVSNPGGSVTSAPAAVTIRTSRASAQRF